MAISKLMREMAYSVLVDDDEAAALALADLLQETRDGGHTMLVPVGNVVRVADSNTLRAVLYLNCQISNVFDIEKVQRDIRDWLDGRNETGTLVWSDVVRRMDVYEFPPDARVERASFTTSMTEPDNEV
jgi:hypothetical protein